MNARREIGKWLNEQPNKDIDRQALAELCAEYDEIRRDAERYRALRLMRWRDEWLCVTYANHVKIGGDCPSGERLDAAIDSAMGRL